FKGNANCPQYIPERDWVSFLQGEYGAYAAFSIRFDKTKGAIGSLQPSTCYTIAYKDGLCSATGRDDTGRSNAPRYSGGDPAQKQMNLRGRIMNFNEFGQV